MKNIFIAILLLATSLAASAQSTPLVFTVYLNDTVQQIRNFGASGCWYTEAIGTTWPAAQKQRLAELLFSRAVGKDGKPKGIGLSAFRYNIGAGTAEQGDSSGIPNPARRVECFLSPDGGYNWNKQAGYTWMLQQAKNYGVENLIAFVNSPPVQFTKDGLGYKLQKDFTSNLKEDKYEAYADFLTEVIKHFDKQNLHFSYISPVNEPQWDWSGVFGHASQEGSPWTNEEIYHAVQTLNASMQSKKLSTKILATEAGMLTYLYEGTTKTSRQVANLWQPASPLFIGGFSNTTPFVEGHGYFTENNDGNMISTRNKLRDSLKQHGKGLEYWQSEYCMLSDGFKEGTKAGRSAMDCALFLAKVIHTDLVEANATAWHYWNSYEPGPADSNTRYYLIALNADSATSGNRFTVTKNLWALGHYSLLVRPGMYRVQTERSDNLNAMAAAQQVMVSAYCDAAGKKLVVNVINYTAYAQPISVVLQGLHKGKTMRLVTHYVTSAKEGDDMRPYAVDNKSEIVLPPRSINSLVFGE